MSAFDEPMACTPEQLDDLLNQLGRNNALVCAVGYTAVERGWSEVDRLKRTVLVLAIEGDHLRKALENAALLTPITIVVPKTERIKRLSAVARHAARGERCLLCGCRGGGHEPECSVAALQPGDIDDA